jgi:hypothetical protein
VSIDAAFANRTDLGGINLGGMRYLWGGIFIAWSKIQKLNSKSSAHAEFIAVSDGMNTPLSLADFINRQGYPPQSIYLGQDNMSCMTLHKKGKATAETTRFIEIRNFWVSAYIQKGAIDVV